MVVSVYDLYGNVKFVFSPNELLHVLSVSGISIDLCQKYMLPTALIKRQIELILNSLIFVLYFKKKSRHVMNTAVSLWLLTWFECQNFNAVNN